MKNIHNALTDVVSMYRANVLEYDIVHHDPQHNLWVVNVYNLNAPGSVIKFEVIDDNGIPKCCVLQTINVGRRSLFRFMNRVVDAL
jgi:hypothetical protein